MVCARAVLISLAALCFVPGFAGVADAAAPPSPGVPLFGHFRSVLAQGEGQTVNATDLAANQANGTAPATFVNQQPLYAGVMPHAATSAPADLDTFYKNTNFGSMPGRRRVLRPRRGRACSIFRDKSFGMAHVYGNNRDDLMFGAGYATAQERLFLMDALRHTAEGTLAGLTGASAAAGRRRPADRPGLLGPGADRAVRRAAAAGSAPRAPAPTRTSWTTSPASTPTSTRPSSTPPLMPAEYAALGVQPGPWTVSDTAALRRCCW